MQTAIVLLLWVSAVVYFGGNAEEVAANVPVFGEIFDDATVRDVERMVLVNPFDSIEEEFL